MEKFRDRVDEDSILVNAIESREVGTECAFAILLADKKVALAGTCVVRDVFVDANNKFMRPGMRLGIKRLGPESQKVFAQLLAKRIAPRRMTQAFPAVSVGRAATQSIPPLTQSIPPVSEPSVPRVSTRSLGSGKTPTPDVKAPAPSVGRVSTQSMPAPRAKTPDVVVPSSVATASVPEPVQRRVTAPMRGLRTQSPSAALEVAREAPRRLPSVQIPPLEGPDEVLLRAPRATPFDLDNVAKQFQREPEPAPAKQVADEPPPAPAKPRPVAVTNQPIANRTEERTPGSPFILPANPFSQLSDASLEGFVDCRLFEGNGGEPPDEFPLGTADPDVPAAELPKRPSSLVIRDGVPRTALEMQRSEPLPLPPPPALTLTRRDSAPQLPYAATKLPDLHTGANDAIREPLVSRRLAKQLLLAVVLVPLLGAAAVVLYMKLATGPAMSAARLAPDTVATPDEPMRTRSQVEPAPRATTTEVPAAPTSPQPIHAVLVRTYPIAARVTVGNRAFGTTPTYIKIPANTRVEVKMFRPGFKPVTYPLTSKTATDRVFVRLQRARGNR
ncbi:MAG TPA: hypothetical protein VIV40_16875 [Kofleriaceae bacterium]